MRILMIVAFSLASTGGALSAQCLSGASNVFSISQWEAFESPAGGYPSIRYDVLNGLDKGVRMVSAYVTAEDALGRTVVQHFGVPRDLVLASGQSTTIEATSRELGADRFLTVNPDDLTVSFCLRSVVYEDGTKEEF